VSALYEDEYIYLKNSFYALKLDMMKEYDCVEWDYLEAIMYKFGFAQQWIIVVIVMVISLSFSIIL
jgi:hypothetical protein